MVEDCRWFTKDDSHYPDSQSCSFSVTIFCQNSAYEARDEERGGEREGFEFGSPLLSGYK